MKRPSAGPFFESTMAEIHFTIYIIKTGDIKGDQKKLFDFLIKHGKEELATREFIGKLLQKKTET